MQVVGAFSYTSLAANLEDRQPTTTIALIMLYLYQFMVTIILINLRASHRELETIQRLQVAIPLRLLRPAPRLMSVGLSCVSHRDDVGYLRQHHRRG